MTTEYLLEREVDRVLAALMPDNALVCRVMLQTGLRVSDVLALQYWQIGTNFWITEGKTGKRRHVGLTRQLVDEIRARADHVIPSDALYKAHSGQSDAPICWAFPSPRNWRQHRTRQAVWKDLKRASKAFRLGVNVGTHSMRKVYAVDLMEKYKDLPRVQRALNHSSSAVTVIYAFADKLLTENRRKRPRSVKSALTDTRC